MSILDKFRCKKESTSISDPTDAEKESAGASDSHDRVTAKLNQYREMDDNARNYYRSFEPEIGVEVIGNKTYLSIGDVEFCADYVSEIKVTELGRGPKASSHYDYLAGSHAYIYSAMAAKITVVYVSGRTTDIICNRHIVDYVFDRLLTAHRDALRNG